MMLQRNLLYTGITRAKKLVVLAGSRRALAAAVRTAGAGRRHTALAHRSVCARIMSRSTSPAPTEGNWSTSPTSSRCAPGTPMRT